jgi:hypothetical protein
MLEPDAEEVKLTTQAGVNINFVNTTVNSPMTENQYGRLQRGAVVNNVTPFGLPQFALHRVQGYRRGYCGQLLRAEKRAYGVSAVLS